MTIVTSGPISLNAIAAEFGGSTPHSLSEYFKGGANVPATITGTATYSAASSDGTVNDVSVPGLTVKRFTRQSPELDDNSDASQAILRNNKYYNFRFNYSVTHTRSTQTVNNPGNENDYCMVPMGDPRPYFQILSDRAEPNIALSSGKTGGGNTNTNSSTYFNIDFLIDGSVVGNTAPSGTTLTNTTMRQFHKHKTGGVNDGGSNYPNCSNYYGGSRSNTNGVTITLVGYPTSDTTIAMSKLGNYSNDSGGAGTQNAITTTNLGDSVYYLWTNGTGGTISIESTSLSSTDQVIQPDGSDNFAVSYTDAQVNPNVAVVGSNSGISIKQFYGGRKT